MKKLTIKPLTIIERRSTDTIAVQDPDIAKALKFIRESTYKLIQIDDVAEHIGLSRRTLERKFKKTLKHSVGCEIRSVRLRKLENVLANSDMTLEEIATKFGYSDPENICRFMKNQLNISPSHYRRNL